MLFCRTRRLKTWQFWHTCNKGLPQRRLLEAHLPGRQVIGTEVSIRV